MSALLELSGVSAAYGQSEVLWDIDLVLPEASVTALIGRNGVGKTTLLKTIIGTQGPTAGTIRLAGADVTRAAPFERARAGIGYVPQGRHIFPHLTVAENLATGLSAIGGRGDGSARVVPDHIYALFPKLRDISGRKGGFLSGGEQQQLAIGRALAGRPRLLLLDEPTEGIQPNVVEQIGDALRTVRNELGVTVLIVEQYLDFVWGIADHYVVMQGGRVLRTGDTETESAAQVAHLVQI